MIKRKHLLFICLIALLGWVVYANSLGGKFIWDDEALVQNNTHIKSWVFAPKLFSENILAGAKQSCNFYRPMQMLTYMFDYTVWGLNVFGYHLANAFWHIAAALALYWLINIIFADALLAFLTCALFVVHPIHTEAVSYISGRADSLVMIFMLLTMVFYIKLEKQGDGSLKERTVPFVLMLGSYVLAFFSKEYAIILPLFILVYHWAFKKKILKKEFFSLLAVSLVYVVLRLSVLKFTHIANKFPLVLPQRIPGFFIALINYFKLLFFPSNLHMEYGHILADFLNPQVAAGVIVFIALLACAFIFKNNGRVGRIVFFAIIWFFVGLIPVANIFPLNVYMAEHWLYVPSVGFFLLMAAGMAYLYRTAKYRALIFILIAAILAVYSFLTIKQNNYWKEPLGFFERTAKFLPYDPTVLGCLANTYNRAHMYGKALGAYKQVVEFSPQDAEARSSLADAYWNIGSNDEAVSACQEALKLDPKNASAYSNLCNVYWTLGRIQEAEVACKKAIELKPELASAYNNLGNVYLDSGRQQEARLAYERAIKEGPDNARVYYNLGNFYGQRNELEKAVAVYRKAIEIDPLLPAPYLNLANIYRDTGYFDAAIELYLKGLSLEPNNAMLYNNLALAYYLKKDYVLAIQYLDKAVELKGKVHPDFLKALEPYRKK